MFASTSACTRTHAVAQSTAGPRRSRQSVAPGCCSRHADVYPTESRRSALAQVAAGAAALSLGGVARPASAVVSAASPEFVTTASGLRIEDIREGSGAAPQNGDRVTVHWSGRTSGYQGKRIDNTSTRDEPYEFVLGADTTIAAFNEAVAGMKAGGIRRVEAPGKYPGLVWPLNRGDRFTNELKPNSDGKVYAYRVGPQPYDLGGNRAVDFVLDNGTLKDFNRTMLFDIKLLTVRPSRR